MTKRLEIEHTVNNYYIILLSLKVLKYLILVVGPKITLAKNLILVDLNLVTLRTYCECMKYWQTQITKPPKFSTIEYPHSKTSDYRR